MSRAFILFHFSLHNMDKEGATFKMEIKNTKTWPVHYSGEQYYQILFGSQPFAYLRSFTLTVPLECTLESAIKQLADMLRKEVPGHEPCVMMLVRHKKHDHDLAMKIHEMLPVGSVPMREWQSRDEKEAAQQQPYDF